jgi:uncharacterized membrane protein
MYIYICIFEKKKWSRELSKLMDMTYTSMKYKNLNFLMKNHKSTNFML